VPPQIERVVLRAMEREPRDRYATAGDFCAALETQIEAAPQAISLTRRQRVPAPPPLVGRGQEIAELAALLERHSLVTLVGPGGVGKTSLALHVARTKENDFRDGSALIPLIEARSSDDLVAAIGEAIGVTFAGARSTKAQLLDAIADRHLLLVLDGFEHLMSAAILVGEVMRCGAHISIIVTSRERLNISEECVLEIAGLPLGASRPNADIPEAAMALFLQRARQADSRFEPPEDPTVIRRILSSVSGLPLGIEIAASLLRVLSCDEIAEELERDPGGMTTSRRDIPERQRSLRDVFEQSWTLLDEQQRSSLIRLSVLRGSFSREAAQAVAGGGLGVLAGLLDKSLLHRAADGRFAMHDVIRQFAAAKLRDEPDAKAAALDAQMEHFAKQIAELEPDLQGARVYEAVDVIGADLEGIRGGWRRAIERARDDLVRIYLNGLFRFYLIRGRYAEADAELAKAEGRAKNDRLAALILARRGTMAQQAGLPTARELLRRSIGILRISDRNSVEMGMAYRHLGFIATEQGKHRAALRLYDRAFKLLRGRAGGDEIGWLLLNASVTYSLAGEHGAAERALNEAAAIFKETGEPRNQMISLINLAIVMTDLGRLDEALQLRVESLTIARRVGDGYLLGAALINLAESTIALGNYERARELLREAREHHQLVGRPHGVCKCELFTARVDRLEGDTASAERKLRLVVSEASRLNAVPMIMEAALEYALLFQATGREADAKTLASLVAAHPATGAAERCLAEQLSATLRHVGESGSATADRFPQEALASIKRIVLT
jgi:predicted ATPase